MTDTLEDRGWQALEFLRKTDEEHAKLEAEAKRAEHRYKRSVAAYVLAFEGAVEIRKSKAVVEAESVYVDYLDLQNKADALKNKRLTAQETVGYVRTIMANRRMG